MKKIKITGGVLLFIFIVFSIYSFYPKITYEPDYDNKPGRIFVTDRFWEVITDKQNKNGYYKHIKTDVDSLFVKSLILIEDKNYYSHFWVDIKSKIRAIFQNIKAWKVISWWSTITEQYVKNKHFIWEKRTILQKLREAYLSFIYNFEYSKKLVLQLYYHNAYFWNNIYGIGWAMDVYFWKEDMNNLTHEEITILISLLNNPGVKSLEEKYFREYFDIVKFRLNFEFERTIFRLEKKENIDKFPFVTQRVLENAASSQQNIPLSQPFPQGEKGVEQKNAASSLPWGEIERGSFKSTIDSELQKFAKTMLNETLDSLKWKNVTNWAFVVYNPKTMEVLAYQGSRDFDSTVTDWEVDVIRSKRQLWSTLKPFLYLQALKYWANPDDLVIDMESEYNSFKEGKVYISENYSLKEYGLVRFKKALWNSLNNASVRLAKELGIDKVWQFYKDYGIDLIYKPEHYGYSLVLWNPSISLENLVLSYRNLLADYKIRNKYKLNFIYDEDMWKAIYAYSTTNIDKDKFLLYNILSNPDNRDISFWVNSILNTSIRQAVKTWTSSDFRDNIIVSYHPDLVVGIWIGNNDNSSMIWVSGITWAWYLWHQIIEKSIELWIITDIEYETPEWIEKWEYCLDSDCFRKEIIYKKTWKDYKSSIIENKYYIEDIFEQLSGFEREKLDDMGFDIIK